MNRLIKRIYEVFEANKQLFIDAGLEPIATIDLYRGQPQNPGQFEIFPTPAIFLEPRITWTTVGKIKEGDGDLDVHILFDSPYSETANLFTNYDEALTKAFAYNVVDSILQGLTSEAVTPLDLKAEQPMDGACVVYQKNSYTFKTFKSTKPPTTIRVDATDATLTISGKLIKKIAD